MQESMEKLFILCNNVKDITQQFTLIFVFSRGKLYEKNQLVTISRPSAYGEYEPYNFVDTKEEFEHAVVNM